MTREEDAAPYHVEVDVTDRTGVDELHDAMAQDPGFMADKVLRCMDLLRDMDRRQVLQQREHAALRDENAALRLQVEQLSARFDNITAALDARKPTPTV